MVQGGHRSGKLWRQVVQTGRSVGSRWRYSDRSQVRQVANRDQGRKTRRGKGQRQGRASTGKERKVEASEEMQERRPRAVSPRTPVMS